MSRTLELFRKEVKIAQSLLQGDNKLVIEDFIPGLESIIETFTKQGHSGQSAPMVASILKDTIDKALKQKPLSDLTGDDSEWGAPNQVGDLTYYQNVRDASVYKHGKDGPAKCGNAIVWRGEEDWDVFTGTVEEYSSAQELRFPTQAIAHYVDVRKELFDEEKHKGMTNIVEHGEAKYVYFIKDRTQLEKVKVNYWLGGKPLPVSDEEE